MPIKKDNLASTKLVRQRIIELMYRLIYEKKVASKSAFGKPISVTPAAISRWENGTGFPTLENIISIYKVYGVTPNELIIDIDKKTADSLAARVTKLEWEVVKMQRSKRKS